MGKVLKDSWAYCIIFSPQLTAMIHEEAKITGLSFAAVIRNRILDSYEMERKMNLKENKNDI